MISFRMILFFSLLLLLQGYCQAQLVIDSLKKYVDKQDSIVVDFSFNVAIKDFVLDSSISLTNTQQQSNYLVRLGICVASAIFFKPGGSPALCDIVPPVKRW